MVYALILILMFGVPAFAADKTYARQYKKELKQARALLQDERSTEVFDKAVELFDNPEFTQEKVFEWVASGEFKAPSWANYWAYNHPQAPVGIGVTVIDAGAGGGSDSGYIVRFSEWVGDKGRVLAFEPDPAQFDFLKKDIAAKGIKNIQFYQMGLWDCEDTILLHTGDGGISSFVWGYSFEGEKFLVDVVDLDTFCHKNGIEKVDFIKIETQGSEPYILEGAQNTLRKDKPRLAISCFAQPDYLFKFILQLNAMDLGYKFWMDYHSPNFLSGLVLYASVDN